MSFPRSISKMSSRSSCPLSFPILSQVPPLSASVSRNSILLQGHLEVHPNMEALKKGTWDREGNDN